MDRQADTVARVETEAGSFAATGGARRHRSTAGTQAATDAELVAAHLAELERDGFTTLKLFDADEVDAMRRTVLPHLGRTGRNRFEGERTQRLYAVIEKTLAMNPLVEHPLVLGLLDRLFLPNYLLSQLQVINILPGEAAQPLHFDEAFYPLTRPREPLGYATIMALDDFTLENGATVAIPGSHRWGDRMPSAEESAAAVPVVMPAGSAVLFSGLLWHGGGSNRSEAPRLAATAQYCAPWVRTQENYSLAVSRERARQCSEHVQRMLGYSVHAPFMGMVNGMHPKRVLEG